MSHDAPRCERRPQSGEVIDGQVQVAHAEAPHPHGLPEVQTEATMGAPAEGEIMGAERASHPNPRHQR